MSFEKFELHPKVVAGIKSKGYAKPTPIQKEAIPKVLEGRDLMGLAQTGTGKTAAFVLPILNRLMEGPRRKMRALVLAPTRELAQQIHDEAVALAVKTGLRGVTIYGGVSMVPQLRGLSTGAEIVVACPGRLLDHIGQGNADLSTVEVLVLDEADRMLDMGFMPDIRRILKYVPKNRQTLMFSATMPADVRRLANDVLSDPLTVSIGGDAPASTVSHAIYPCEQHLKTPLLKEILVRTEADSVLVFARTKHRASNLADKLRDAGFSVASLQGDMSQNKRQAALEGFRSGRYRIMVATDIAARGIDVTRISHVINYDMPDTAEAYTHRIGRTGRAERTGDALSLATSQDASLIRSIERILDSELVMLELENFDYSIPPPADSGRFRRPSRPAARPARTARPRGEAHGRPARGAQPGKRRQAAQA